jgi:hypothetical protein
MSETWDPDISVMALSAVEKNGLQVFRNYSKAFEAKRVSDFVAGCDAKELSVADLEVLLGHIGTEEARTLPVIACAYADDQLKSMYGRELPSDLIGGRSQMLNGFGSLARLSQRIQAAHAFGWLSPDALGELDVLRGLRNALSHNWDLKVLEQKMGDLVEKRLFALEQHLSDGIRLPRDFHERLDPIQRLRVRLTWLMGRTTYECALWVPALKAQLNPNHALYGLPPPPKFLLQISAVCLSTTMGICGR